MMAAVFAATAAVAGCTHTQPALSLNPTLTSTASAILVKTELPRTATRGEQVEISVQLMADGPSEVEIELAADAVSLRATPERSYSPSREDVIWTIEHVTVMPSVPAIASRTMIAPDEARTLPTLRVEVDLPTGSYSLRACVRLRTDSAASSSVWCSAASSFTVL